MEAEDLLDKIAQDEGFGNWETVVLNCHHSVIRSVVISAVNQALRQPVVSGSLPSDDRIVAEAIISARKVNTEEGLLPNNNDIRMFCLGAKWMRDWVQSNAR